MSKFIVTLICPDGKFTEEEVETAMNNVFHPKPGVVIRGFLEVNEVKEAIIVEP